MTAAMVSFCVSESGEDSGERRSMLCAAIEANASSHWEETTSFYAIETEVDLKELTVYLGTLIDQELDTVLVRSLDKRQAFVTGSVSDRTLFKILPYCTKV